MDLLRSLVILVCLILLFHTDRSVVVSEPLNPLSFITDLIQSNVAGAPVVHEHTEWNFDPEVGKQRRVRYEQENGRHGEHAIEKLGMGIGYEGPWGTVVENRRKISNL
ncbi:unnamed protein product [Xylocopa violacea]|uniref:Uncharacterized protein n=1 Tax=Xylocopa violacea TaxID=135666 RepID=A0ABP1NI10_XYLVO